MRYPRRLQKKSEADKSPPRYFSHCRIISYSTISGTNLKVVQSTSPRSVRRSSGRHASDIPYYKFDFRSTIAFFCWNVAKDVVWYKWYWCFSSLLGVANNTDRRSTLSSLSSYLESNGKGARIWVLKRSSDYLCFSSSLPISSEIGIKMINKNSRQLAILNGYFK